jgi:hypothetical protein
MLFGPTKGKKYFALMIKGTNKAKQVPPKTIHHKIEFVEDGLFSLTVFVVTPSSLRSLFSRDFSPIILSRYWRR